jgi:putative Holliday junction resolvase
MNTPIKASNTDRQQNGYVIAIDFGLKYVGIAASSQLIPKPFGITTLKAQSGKLKDWPKLEEILVEYKPHTILVGLPLNMDGSESEMSERAKEFGESLSSRTSIPVEFVDERLSSWEVKKMDQENSRNKQKKTFKIHEASACLIAQTWVSDIKISREQPNG